MNLKYLLAITALLLLTACGGGSSSGNNSAVAKITGQFIDDKVQGLKYTCSSGRISTTTVDGEYTCNVGDNVTFSINNVSIGSSVAAQTDPINPYTLFPNDNDAALNLARLLQSLNTKGIVDVIDINSTLESKVPADTDFTSPIFETSLETALGITLISSSVAQASMNSAIVAAGGSIPVDLNTIPTANAGEDIFVLTSSSVTLNGSNSTDADSDVLTYLWNIVTTPSTSTATLSDSTVVNPTFTADLEGVYTIELIVNDGITDSLVDTVTVTANSSANAKAPIIADSTGTIAENASVGDAVGNVTITSVGSSPISAITLSGTGSENFEVSTAGAITVKTGASLNYETTQVYNLTAVATNSSGNSTSVTVTISVTNVVDFVPTLANSTGTVVENATSGTFVGSITISSIGDSAITAITLSGTGNENFEASTDGNITLKASASLDYATTQDYNLSAVATNSSGNSASVTVNISVSKIPSIVPVLSNSTGTIAENASVGDAVGNVTITSVGDSSISAITLSGTGNENFEVSTAGAITVKTGASLNYETTTTYNLTAVATSLAGNSASVTLSITVTNIVETLTLAASTGSVAENASTGASVGSISITNAGESAITAITLSGTGNGNFEVSTAGAITVKAGASLDYGITQSYSLTAVATNAQGNSASVSLTISIVNVAGDVPTLSNSTGTILEGASTGSSVGTLTITDVGDSSVTAITLSGTGSENFSVSTAGAISVKAGASLDYETTQTYNLTAIATNSEGSSTSVTLTISVLNTIEVPTIVNSTASIDENASVGASVGTLTITSAGDSNITAITLSGSGEGNFSISTAGAITVKAGATLDYETKTKYNLTATATNLAGNSTSRDLNISVNDILDTATFYIKSAVYDNNATASVADDKLYIYFDQNASSSDANTSAYYTLSGTGAIGSGSGSDYNNSFFHQHIVSLDATSTALVVNSTNISIGTSVLRDTLGHPTIYDANTTQAQKFRVLLKTGLSTSYPTNNASDRDDGHYQTGKTRSYTDDSNGTIIDNVTGLIWQQSDDNTNKNWTTAGTYCTALSLGGYSDWRLPTIEELDSLNDYGKTSPDINTTYFTDTESYYYWSSTALSSDTTRVYSINFTEGTLSSLSKTNTVRVRCVRTYQ